MADELKPSQDREAMLAAFRAALESPDEPIFQINRRSVADPVNGIAEDAAEILEFAQAEAQRDGFAFVVIRGEKEES